MPIDHKENSTFLSQRNQYKKGGVGKWYWDFRDRKIFGFIGSDKINILDMGCGEGVTLEKLIKLYPSKNIKGIDIMPENIRICKQYNLPVEEGSIYEIKNSTESIDMVILSEIVEHLDDFDLALENIKSILRPGGEIIIVFPNDLSFKIARIIFFKFKEAFADPGHVNKFNPKKMKKIIEEHGFKIKKIINTPFGFWFPSLHCLVCAEK